MIAVVYGVWVGGNTNPKVLYHGYAIKTVVVCYTWFWDCYMDWGLWDVSCKDSSLKDTWWSALCCSGNKIFFRKSSKEQAAPVSSTSAQNTTEELNESTQWYGLRKVLMYAPAPLYYAAIVLDFIFRYLWVISLSNLGASLVGPRLNFILATLEILRRCGWAILRVEYEHLKRTMQHKVGFELPVDAPNAHGPQRRSSAIILPPANLFLEQGTKPEVSIAEALSSNYEVFVDNHTYTATAATTRVNPKAYDLIENGLEMQAIVTDKHSPNMDMAMDINSDTKTGDSEHSAGGKKD
jgi:hypothetical protein